MPKLVYKDATKICYILGNAVRKALLTESLSLLLILIIKITTYYRTQRHERRNNYCKDRGNSMVQIHHFINYYRKRILNIIFFHVSKKDALLCSY
jgi:hypothetical protein